MAYSDYGGYAYRNGKRIIERSDCTITPDGIVKSPIIDPTGHVVLGDGPIFAILYKQSGLRIFRGMEELDPAPLLQGDIPDGALEWDQGKRYLNSTCFGSKKLPCELAVDGHRITAFFIEPDNYYIFGRVIQPDGTIWTGFSGYGVGAGLEYCGYGFNTEDQINQLFSLFPEPQISEVAKAQQAADLERMAK